MNTIPTQTSAAAIVSLVSGILAWTLMPIIGALVAIICGHIARSEIRRAFPGTLAGDGLALSGLVLGYLQLVVTLLIVAAIIVAIVLFGAAAGGWR